MNCVWDKTFKLDPELLGHLICPIIVSKNYSCYMDGFNLKSFGLFKVDKANLLI